MYVYIQWPRELNTLQIESANLQYTRCKYSQTNVGPEQANLVLKVTSKLQAGEFLLGLEQDWSLPPLI